MSEIWTVLRLMEWCREFFTQKGIETSRLDAELLIAHAMGVDRLGLYLRYDQQLTEEELTEIRKLVRRRAEREPVAHLVGTKEFFGLSFLTDARAMVPRPETETLVETVLSILPEHESQTLCDVGTGTGCIALTLARLRPAWSLLATDASPEALALAAENVAQLDLGERVQFRQIDLLDGVETMFDAIVSNPPYIPTAQCDQTMPEVARFDPRLALDGGAEGLDVIRRLVRQAKERLVEEGLLALECGFDQADQIAALLNKGGYRSVRITRDLAGRQRVVSARKGD